MALGKWDHGNLILHSWRDFWGREERLLREAGADEKRIVKGIWDEEIV